MTEWRDVVGREGIYKVSDLGDVIRISTGRTLKQHLSIRGYLVVGMRTKESSKQKLVFVHRVVALAFVEGHKQGLQVNHIDGSKTNNKSENLEWVTGRENIDHAVRIGLSPNPTVIVAAPVSGMIGLCFPSISQASASGYNCGNIYRCLSGGTSQHGGYRWFRAEVPK